MKGSGAFAVLSLLAVTMSSTSADVIQSDGTSCTRIVVNVEVGSQLAGTHSGEFYQVGTSSDGTGLFKSQGGLILLYVPTNDPIAVTAANHLTAQEGSEDSNDVLLDNDVSITGVTVGEETFDRRFLQNCGDWVVGRVGNEDTAEYPVLKISDCVDHPECLDEDSFWVYQECADCEENTDVGEVWVTSEAYECDTVEFTSSGELETSVDPLTAGGISGAGKIGACVGMEVVAAGIAVVAGMAVMMP